MPDAYIPVFKTITLGLHSSAQEYRKALKAGKCRVGELAGQVLDQIETSQDRADLHLVVLSAAELGFRTFTPYDVIRKRAREMGFLICPPEVGPALRLHYTDQPKGIEDFLHIAMYPVFLGIGGQIFALFNMPGPRLMGRGLQLSTVGITNADIGERAFGPGANFVFASQQLRV